jgi:hypothetical protein
MAENLLTSSSRPRGPTAKQPRARSIPIVIILANHSPLLFLLPATFGISFVDVSLLFLVIALIATYLP